MATGYDNQKLNAAPKTTRVTDFDIVSETLLFANNIASRIQALADTLLGCEPALGGQSCADQVPADGTLPRMAAEASRTRGRLGDAMAALDRIERALP